ncbi:MAG: histidine phosphatase family protein [Clostridia bacterium]|nr:histidine phosphatase family protein [Clostridia bacterium]
MILMFVRHGESVDNELTEFGRKQCELMVMSKDNYNFSKIYCSIMNRCKQTAEYFSKKYNLEVEYVSSLKDREMLSNEPKTDDEKEWYDNYLNKNYSHKNPEGCKEFLQRNFREFDRIINAHKDKNENVILVAHSCTFYALQEYLNSSKGENINYCRLSNCSKIYFEI